MKLIQNKMLINNGIFHFKMPLLLKNFRFFITFLRFNKLLI